MSLAAAVPADISDSSSDSGPAPAGDDLQRATLRLGGLYLAAVFLSASLLWGVAGTDPVDSAIGKLFLLAAAALVAIGLTRLLMALRSLPLPAKAVLCFVLSLFAGALYCLIDHAIYIVCVYPQATVWAWSDVAYNFIYGTSLYFGWSCLFLALSYSFELRDRERRLAEMREEALAAQMQALHYQLNPHFLFNTLNSMAGLIEEGAREEARDMVLSLSAYMRTTLSLDPFQDLPLNEEIALQSGYLAIERHRFSDRLNVTIDIDADVRNARVPGLILQPIVENAVKHGAGRKTGRVTIAIRAFAEAGKLCIVVENDMAGTGRVAASARLGIGLRNVSARLDRRFPGDSALAYGAADGGRFRVALTMPLRSA